MAAGVPPAPPVPTSPVPSIAPEVEALLAAGQPRSAASAALRRLLDATRSFAAAAGMAIPPGDTLAAASSVLSRAARASTTPAIATHCQRCVAMLDAARPHVIARRVTHLGARVACKAITTSLAVLGSADVARHVKAGAAMHAASGQDVLALATAPSPGEGGDAGAGTRARWPMDPFLAAALWCLVGGAWSTLGLLARSLTITQGITCGCWFLATYVAWKIRGWSRVKAAIARWKSPALIPARTGIIAATLVAALLLPVTVKHYRYTPAGMDIDEPSSLLAILADPHPVTGMLVANLAAAMVIGLCGVAIVAGLRARDGTSAGKAASFNLWRALAGVAVMALWIAMLSWLVAERVYFPGTTFLDDGEALVRVEIGWGWLVLGFLGIAIA
ncbi:MAG: hypothetical protein GYA24_05070 [Candidatus Lokiarchaeota archaeon]|nr:hypothetical protein [Candidatus Lokiarchaeota archaeon]